MFGELDWSPAVHDQIFGRLHRHGQANPVVAYFLVADDGSDPVIGEVLGLKEEQATGINDPFDTEAEDPIGSRGHIRKLAEKLLKTRLPA